MAKKVSIVEKMDELKNIVAEAIDDAVKFEEKSVGAAGGRVRKHLQGVKKLAQEIRKLVTEVKAERKGEKSNKKKPDKSKKKK